MLRSLLPLWFAMLVACSSKSNGANPALANTSLLLGFKGGTSINANACAEVDLAVGNQGSTDPIAAPADVAVTLAIDGPVGQPASFYLDSACANPGATITLAKGSMTSMLYLKGTVAGTGNVTASASGYGASSGTPVTFLPDVAGNFRTSWASKDLTIATQQGTPFSTCVRFTTLPGPCKYVTEDFSGAGTFHGVFNDTCDIGLEDSDVHIDVLCQKVVTNGCNTPGVTGSKIDETNSKVALTGNETEITGLGDQDWKVGTSLCDTAFGAAKLP